MRSQFVTAKQGRNSMAEDKKKEIAVIEITEEYMKERLYEFRGKKVMLDSDLAEIYGYETKNFKRQVKNNIAKFEGDDFMFELNDEEVKFKKFQLEYGKRFKYKIQTLCVYRTGSIYAYDSFAWRARN